VRSENVIGQLNRLGFNDPDVFKASLFDQLQVISVRQGARHREPILLIRAIAATVRSALGLCYTLLLQRENAGLNLMEYE
jgi:hypothetical protein